MTHPYLDNFVYQRTVGVRTVRNFSKFLVLGRFPTIELKFQEKHFEIRISSFCYIQVIVFDLSYLPVAAIGT